MTKLYKKIIFNYSKYLLIGAFLIIIYLAFNVLNLKIDTSSKSLMLQSDKSLQYFNKISNEYKNEDSLIVAYNSKDIVLSKTNIKIIKELTNTFSKLKGVVSVSSISNVPLLMSSDKSLSEVLENIPTLDKSNLNIKKVKKELKTNPLYTNNLVSKDLKTTALLISLNNNLSSIDKSNLIKEIRQIFKRYSNEKTQLVLGGVSMIANDIGHYISSDLKTYGLLVFILVILTLSILFKDLYFVILSIIILLSSIIGSSGIISLFNLPISVISSNYMALQLIITTSIIVHLIVRFKDNERDCHNLKYNDIVFLTITEMIIPIFLAAFTTIIGFISLLFAKILPVINLGLMMSLSIIFSVVFIFIFFPAFMIVFKKSKKINKRPKNFIIQKLLKISFLNNYILLSITVLFIIITGFYSSKIFVENSFINYFKATTPIHIGMSLIDKKLGGTTPLDIIVDLPINSKKEVSNPNEKEDDFGDFEEEYNDTKNENEYWFTENKLKIIKEVHEYLETKKDIGKVLSLNSIIELGKIINNGKYLDSFEIAIIFNKIPEKYKKILFYPYVDIKNNQLRFKTRIIDSNKDLRRNELINNIKKELQEKLKKSGAKVHLTNIMVLYNNMLQSLFQAQIKTLLLLFGILFLTFLILFKSLKTAIIASIVNLLPVGAVFGTLGYLHIPLDMMTITIAAISTGISIDNTIHYIYKYSNFRKEGLSIKRSIIKTHLSVGHAILYTFIIIILGFLTMVFSEFLPTTYFALLTILALLTSLLTNLIILPKLLVLTDNRK